jgi:hypothetical protein
LVNEIILYYNARSEKHQKNILVSYHAQNKQVLFP